MDESVTTNAAPQGLPPGAAGSERHGLRGYLAGYVGALALTGLSFWAADTTYVWPPGVPILLAVLAIAQMGVHLAFFLKISSAPDHTNDILALALGVFVVALLIFGSLWIMANLDTNMMPMSNVIAMQR